METFKDLPVMAFASQDAWRAWLDENHGTSTGLWLKLHKKGSDSPLVTYAEALDEALCYGWIDSSKYAYDQSCFLQRFSPRKPRSVWSQVNREHVARLLDAGRMQPAGLKAVEVAQANGNWEAAYAPQSRATVPDDFQAALDAEPAAKAYFEGLNQSNRYAFLYRIQAVKQAATRARKIAWAIDRLLRQDPIYP